MPGFARPDADSSDGGWTNEAGGSSLYDHIDEASVDDGDYIKSSTLPVNDVCKISLSNTPGTKPAKVRYRYGKTGAGQINLKVELVEGTTVRATWTHTDISTTLTTVTQTLLDAEFDAITDLNNLYVQFTANVGAAGVTWDSANADNMALSNGDKTALQISNSPDGGCRSTTTHTNGLYYFEITLDSLPGDYTGSIGFATGSRVYDGNAYNTGPVFRVNGGVWYAVGTTNLATVAQGDSLGFIVDFTNQRFWMVCSNSGSGWGSWANISSVGGTSYTRINPASPTGAIDLAYTTGFDETTPKHIWALAIGTGVGGSAPLGVTLRAAHADCTNPNLSTIQGYGYGEW